MRDFPNVWKACCVLTFGACCLVTSSVVLFCTNSIGLRRRYSIFVEPLCFVLSFSAVFVLQYWCRSFSSVFIALFSMDKFLCLPYLSATCISCYVFHIIIQRSLSLVPVLCQAVVPMITKISFHEERNITWSAEKISVLKTQPAMQSEWDRNVPFYLKKSFR